MSGAHGNPAVEGTSDEETRSECRWARLRSRVNNWSRTVLGDKCIRHGAGIGSVANGPSGPPAGIESTGTGARLLHLSAKALATAEGCGGQAGSGT